jgi:Fe-S oxidoreductase
MSKQKSGKDSLEERLGNLEPEDLKRALRLFQEKIHHEYASYLHSCVRCGLCSDSCHYYLTDKEIKSLPAYKLNLIARVFKKYFTLAGKTIPKWIDSRHFNQKMAEEWVDTLFGRCTLCGRCALNCTMGINIPYLIRMARSVLVDLGLVPPGLQSTVDTALRAGNNMGIAKEDWIETVEWLEEELQAEVNDPEAGLPMDKKGTKILYTVNPREPMFFPLSILAVAKIFYAAGESWTFSGENYDVTNYGLYSGDDQAAGEMSDRLLRSLKKLESRILVLAECGHGFNSNRWEAPEWLCRKYGLSVKSILQVVADYIREERIMLDPSQNQKVITLHDPCNLVRLGGIVEEQRFILRHAASKFVEMTPNREKNFCCGGGGGQLAMTRFASRRLQAGKIKAEQIRETGAEIVVAPCHNCIDQLMELNKHYKLGVEIKTVCEIAANALVIN